MAVPGHGEQDAGDASETDGDAGFLRDSSVAFLVPLATDNRLEQAFEKCSGSPMELIEATEARDTLFFDETVNVYFILRTPHEAPARLRSFLDRLTITLDVQIANSSIPGRETPPSAEGIFSGTVKDTERPLAVVSDLEEGGNDEEKEEEKEDESEEGSTDRAPEAKYGQRRKKEKNRRQTYALWKVPVFLARPRTRLHAPSVTFSAAASLCPAPRRDPDGVDAGFLRSLQPNGLNLLAPLAGDPALQWLGGEKVWPRLSAQRVSRVAPAGLVHQQRQLQSRPVRCQAALVQRIVPAVHARIRFVRPSTVPTSAAVLGVLEVDFTPLLDCEVVLTRVRMTLQAGGQVTDLNGGWGPSLNEEDEEERKKTAVTPLYCVARDHLTFLYRLAPPAHGFDTALNTIMVAGLEPSRELDITVEIRVLVRPGDCEPVLALAWTTTIDFSPPVNPGFGAALTRSASLQRAHRPSQLSIDGMASLLAPAVSRPDALPSLEAAAARSTETTIPDFGITMTFSAPSRPVYAGEEFCWTVFVVNRVGSSSGGGGGGGAGSGGSAIGLGFGPPSTPSTPDTSISAFSPGAAGGGGSQPVPSRLRKLALLAIPKRRRNDVRVMRPPSMAGRPRASTVRSTYGAPATAVTMSMGGLPIATTTDVADAVLDENVVHAMQRSSLVDSTDVVCLSADVRVGPLAPHACHVVELRFVALRAGAVGIEAVRVVDLGSQEHVDVRELPAMMILEGEQA